MKISVEGLSPMFKNQVIEAVEKIDEIKFVFLKDDKPKPTTYVFEANESDDVDKGIELIKQAIKETPNGLLIACRVVPYGKIVYYSKNN